MFPNKPIHWLGIVARNIYWPPSIMRWGGTFFTAPIYFWHFSSGWTLLMISDIFFIRLFWTLMKCFWWPWLHASYCFNLPWLGILRVASLMPYTYIISNNMGIEWNLRAVGASLQKNKPWISGWYKSWFYMFIWFIHYYWWNIYIYIHIYIYIYISGINM